MLQIRVTVESANCSFTHECKVSQMTSRVDLARITEDAKHGLDFVCFSVMTEDETDLTQRFTVTLQQLVVK